MQSGLKSGVAQETAPPSVYQRSPLHLQSSEAMGAVCTLPNQAMWHQCTYEIGSGCVSEYRVMEGGVGELENQEGLPGGGGARAALLALDRT